RDATAGVRADRALGDAQRPGHGQDGDALIAVDLHAGQRRLRRAGTGQLQRRVHSAADLEVGDAEVGVGVLDVEDDAAARAREPGRRRIRDDPERLAIDDDRLVLHDHALDLHDRFHLHRVAHLRAGLRVRAHGHATAGPDVRTQRGVGARAVDQARARRTLRVHGARAAYVAHAHRRGKPAGIVHRAGALHAGAVVHARLADREAGDLAVAVAAARAAVAGVAGAALEAGVRRIRAECLVLGLAAAKGQNRREDRSHDECQANHGAILQDGTAIAYDRCHVYNRPRQHIDSASR